jgi:ribosomal protein S18 acetylase RimI-like enzyme
MEIRDGIDKKNIDELIAYSANDLDVAKFTSDRTRFASQESFDRWISKGRTIYSLVNDSENLIGITWFGYSEGGFTLAIRLYGEARGKGLAGWFLKETMDRFMKTEEYSKGESQSFWLEVSKDNLPAVKTYEKLGFKFEREGTEPNKMILSLYK